MTTPRQVPGVNLRGRTGRSRDAIDSFLAPVGRRERHWQAINENGDVLGSDFGPENLRRYWPNAKIVDTRESAA